MCPGALYPTSMRINEQGRLVVNFRTKARFRGLFVESHSGGRIKRAGETEDTDSMICFIDFQFLSLWTSPPLDACYQRNLHVIHGDECGPPRPDLQPHVSEERAHLQPASPAVDLHIRLCCKAALTLYLCAV